MAGALLHVGATVLCAHGGTAFPTASNPRVIVSGQPTVVQSTTYSIAGCPFDVSGSPVPCISAEWVVAATRVFSNGQPLVLMNSQAVCTPHGTPLLPTAAQARVIGS
jgi:hypothetical protein